MQQFKLEIELLHSLTRKTCSNSIVAQFKRINRAAIDRECVQQLVYPKRAAIPPKFQSPTPRSKNFTSPQRAATPENFQVRTVRQLSCRTVRTLITKRGRVYRSSYAIAARSTHASVPSVRYVRLQRTNLRVVRLSLNRSQKSSALLSTTPRLRTRSSTNDLAPLRRM